MPNSNRQAHCNVVEMILKSRKSSAVATNEASIAATGSLPVVAKADPAEDVGCGGKI
jgi:hypothetical protein